MSFGDKLELFCPYCLKETTFTEEYPGEMGQSDMI
ncbi:hypothetical protein LCGC14_2001340, partial [marine sediment metagenome]